MTRPGASATTRPYAHAGRARRLVRRTAATTPMTWLYTRIQKPMDELVYRLTRGRTTASSALSGLPVVMLTTTGAKSGRPQTVPVLGLPDADGLVVVASNYGRDRHPSWYHNLRADPRCAVSVGGVAHQAEAEVLQGPDRDARFDHATTLYPGFATYRRRAPSRLIPVVLLHLG